VNLQINIAKYNADQEIMNSYENLKIVWSQFFTEAFILSIIWISIGLSVFGFVANEYKQIANQSHSTIPNIWSAIRWVIKKVILNYLPLPN